MTDEEVDALVASIPEQEVASIDALTTWARSVEPNNCYYVTDPVPRFHGPSEDAIAQGIMDKLFSEELMSEGLPHNYGLPGGVHIPDRVYHHLIDRRSMFSM